MCSALPETIVSSIRHQHIHAMKNKTFVYFCPDEGCQFRTSSYGSAKFHVSMRHRENYHQDPAATEKIFCPYSSSTVECSFSSVSFWEFVQHLYKHLDNGDRVMCPISGCSRDKDFKTKSVLQCHLSLYHKGWRDEGCPKQQYISSEEPSSNLTRIPVEENYFSPDDDEPMNNENTEYSVLNDDMVVESIAKFYLHLYAENLLPQTTIQEICDGLVFLTELVQARSKLILSNELKKLSISEETINLICYKVKMADILFTSHHKSCPGPSLTSNYLRMKYFRENFGYQEPKQINLEENDPDSKNTLQYIPVSESLSKLFEDESIQKEIQESFYRQPNTGDEVSDYYDGSIMQSEDHPPKEIRINIYQDSFNPVMNALGSAKNTFKDLVVYFTIANFKAHLRSRIATKHLIMICREQVFKDFGAKKCLKELMLELKKLESTGISFLGETIGFVVEFMLGDNLGQHLIGGFLESFSCIFFCRFCEIKRKTFKSNPTMTKSQRTVESYNRCAMLSIATGKSCKGIKGKSVLNELKIFHATSHLPPCIGHDLFEGVVSWDLAAVISRFVQTKKWFTYKLLNERIKKFKCKGIDTPNKPAPVRKKGEKLGGHAVQNWMLLRLLVFIIGDKIQDFTDPGWILYIQLKELCEIFCAPSFLKSSLPYVQDVLIPAYFETRQSLSFCPVKYPLKPKHHYMVHYPELMIKFGPIIHLWTMPFEQQHSFFKNVMRKSGNFINPEYTCAVRYQLNFCYASTTEMFDDAFFGKNATPLSASSYTGDLAAYLSRQNLNSWFDNQSVSVGKIIYKRGDMLLLTAVSNLEISVGIIKIIATNENNLIFVTEEYGAVYNQTTGLYAVNLNSLPSHSAHNFSALKYPIPQPLYTWKGSSYFSLKFKLVHYDTDDQND
ncbi:hypothetical protein FOCC_FOCC011053 [Frankliniella occidentalis]|nr:hypothetical protein FOCC_FOCC011053 [Frankliniella occidentalis]